MSQAPSASEPGSFSPVSLLAAIETGRPPLVLDVRSRHEYAEGHVPGAVHMPFWLVPVRWAQIAERRHEKVVVYCGHGPRALMAAAYLRWRGFSSLRQLEGHWSGWRRRGLPMVK